MSAIGNDVITRGTGYLLLPGVFQKVTPNLPIIISVYAEINTANQGTIELNDDGVPIPVQVTNIQQVAAIAGWGSPCYQACKILFQANDGIPIFLSPQLQAVGATAKIYHLTVTGTATATVTHYLTIAGRQGIGGQSYGVNITSGDSAGTIHAKISDVVQAALGCPLSAVATDYYATLTSKHKGLTANEITLSVDTRGNAAGLTYTATSTQAGSGTPSVTASLDLIGSSWIPLILNGYGLASTVITQLQTYNGVPVIGSNPPTGRYQPQIFKPFLAVSGFASEDPSAITDALLNQVTIETAPAPLSDGLSIEAAANYILLRALCLRDTPELDIAGRSYIDMPTPKNIGLMTDWQERDRMAKKGCSTVTIVGGVYQIQDPITTYHPVGENPPQFRYARNLAGVDWNTYHTFNIFQNNGLMGCVILNDGQPVNPTLKSITPKKWKADLIEMGNNLIARGLWVDLDFFIQNLNTGISTINPDRMMTQMFYKRSGVVRQSDTEATAGFNVGTLISNP